MSFDPAYQRVTPIAAERMFSVFPTRYTKPQVESLRLVLWAAMGTSGMSTAKLRDLVLRRLLRSGMDVAQRAQWLCAGLFVAKDDCLPLQVDFVATGGDARVRHIVDFFAPHDQRRRSSLSLEDWHADELAQLIQTLGRRVHRFNPPEGGGFLRDEQVTQRKFQILLTSWVRTLAGRAHDEATDALEQLVAKYTRAPESGGHGIYLTF